MLLPLSIQDKVMWYSINHPPRPSRVIPHSSVVHHTKKETVDEILSIWKHSGSLHISSSRLEVYTNSVLRICCDIDLIYYLFVYFFGIVEMRGYWRHIRKTPDDKKNNGNTDEYFGPIINSVETFLRMSSIRFCVQIEFFLNGSISHISQLHGRQIICLFISILMCTINSVRFAQVLENLESPGIWKFGFQAWKVLEFF